MPSVNNTVTIQEERRPCVVCDERALFHKWCNVDKLVIKPKCMLSHSQLDDILELYERTGCLPYSVDTEKISRFYAIVEFEDGSIREVNPSNIRFLDVDTGFKETFERLKGEKYEY